MDCHKERRCQNKKTHTQSSMSMGLRAVESRRAIERYTLAVCISLRCFACSYTTMKNGHRISHGQCCTKKQNLSHHPHTMLLATSVEICTDTAQITRSRARMHQRAGRGNHAHSTPLHSTTCLESTCEPHILGDCDIFFATIHISRFWPNK